MTTPTYGDVTVQIEGHVALVEIHRPPHNHFDAPLIENLADAFEALDQDPECRSVMLASEGKSFCAGANFKQRVSGANEEVASEEVARREVASSTTLLYQNAVRLFACSKPIVAAIQGAAVGGGLGLALVADFRVVSPDARFAANFVKLGIHPGFGLTYTLPRLIGMQRANLMFYTGRRIAGEQAVEWGLGDLLAPADRLRSEALALAVEIAEGAPLAVQSTRSTMRLGLADAVKTHTAREHSEQSRLFKTEDHKEGVRAVGERRPGQFKGR